MQDINWNTSRVPIVTRFVVVNDNNDSNAMTSCRMSNGIPAELLLSLDDPFVLVNDNNDSNVM